MGVQPETFLFNSPRRYFCTGWCSMQDMFSSKWELDPGNVFLLQRWWFDPRCDFFFAKVGLIQVVSFSRTTGFWSKLCNFFDNNGSLIQVVQLFEGNGSLTHDYSGQMDVRSKTVFFWKLGVRPKHCEFHPKCVIFIGVRSNYLCSSVVCSFAWILLNAIAFESFLDRVKRWALHAKRWAQELQKQTHQEQ